MNSLANLPPREKAFAFVAGDTRADRGERNVLVEPHRISISRRVNGVAMRVAVPTGAFSGVALSLAPRKTGNACYQVTLVHPDAELSVVLEQALDDREIISSWQFWSGFLGSPRLVERSPGVLEAMDRRLGGLPQGEAKAARRTRLTRQRHGNFQSRRQPGLAGRSATVFAGEREIICYE